MRLAAIAAGLTILAAPAFAGQQEVPAETRADAPLRGVLTKPGWNHLEVRTLRGVLSSLQRKPRGD